MLRCGMIAVHEEIAVDCAGEKAIIDSVQVDRLSDMIRKNILTISLPPHHCLWNQDSLSPSYRLYPCS